MYWPLFNVAGYVWSGGKSNWAEFTYDATLFSYDFMQLNEMQLSVFRGQKVMEKVWYLTLINYWGTIGRRNEAWLDA